MMVRNGGTFLMWDMGVGKTLTCILAFKKVGIPVMVLAPLNAALITWPDELDKWAPELSYTVLHGKSKEHQVHKAINSDVIIMNFDGLKWWYKMVDQRKFKLKQQFFVIWDESSMLKNSETIRWQIMIEAMPIWSPYRVCLSGTPMPGTLEDLWSQYYLLDNGKRLGQNIWQFRNKYFDWDAKRFKATIKKGANKIIYSKIRDVTDRLDGKDYLELPKAKHIDIRLTLPPRLRRMYTELEKEFMLQFPNGVAEASSKGVLTCKLRQFLQGGLYIKEDMGLAPTGEYNILHDLKIQHLKGMVESSGGHPILAPIQFGFEYDLICKTFKKEIPIIAGRTSPKNATKYVRQWNEGVIPLLVVHPRSVAFSLNLQFGGHIICWVALPWELDLYSQLIRRLVRQGQKSDRVFIHRIMFEDTKDDDVAQSLLLHHEEQEKLFNAMKQN